MYADYLDYGSTTLEMIRRYAGKKLYISSLKELQRILKKGGILGLGEPMHFDALVPQDIASYVKKKKTNGENALLPLRKQERLSLSLGLQYCKPIITKIPINDGKNLLLINRYA